MQARMTNPAFVVPDAMEALQALGAAIGRGGVPPKTINLVLMRASQINGCAVCLDLHTKDADQKKYPKHTDEQFCGRCLHFTEPGKDQARCDLFNKLVPKGGWCSGFSKRP